MSQAKVDKYKKEKANRKKEMAKQKTEKMVKQTVDMEKVEKIYIYKFQ